MVLYHIVIRKSWASGWDKLHDLQLIVQVYHILFLKLIAIIIVSKTPIEAWLQPLILMEILM